MPQVPGQGSIHLLFRQDFSFGHSEFITHSGLQPEYGSPKNVGKQVQDPAPLSSLQTALVPQGEGLQGCAGSSMGLTKNEAKLSMRYFANSTVVGEFPQKSIWGQLVFVWGSFWL